MKYHRACAFLFLAAFAPAVHAQTAPQPPVNEATVKRGPRIPVYSMVEGQPVETRPPEKADDAPLFPEQTRAPYHASTPYQVTTLASNLRAPWGMAFLAGGKILLTERLPGAMRIVDRDGAVSEPLTGLSALASGPQIGLLDVALDPRFASNHRIFFTWFEWAEKNVNNTNVASARLDLAKGALRDVKTIFKAV
ncbi:MAG TPA: PQQ-dependent sugar dehydrogenase, partial [Rhizomicrobium sp.]